MPIIAMALSPDQAAVVELAVGPGRRNLALSGAPGTGKSFCVAAMAAAARRQPDLKLVVTATTAAAASRLNALDGVRNATTIDALLKLVPTFGYGAAARRHYFGKAWKNPTREIKRMRNGGFFRRSDALTVRLRHTNLVIVIDEMSMMSALKFELVLDVLNHIRRRGLPEDAHLTLVLVQDAIQLPPVPDAKHDPRARFFFESPRYTAIGFVERELKTHHRCGDPWLQQCIRECRTDGKVSEPTLKHLRRTCCKVVAPGTPFASNSAVWLCSSRERVRQINQLRYNALGPLKEHVYRSKATGPRDDIRELRQRFSASTGAVHLKMGCWLVLRHSYDLQGYCSGARVEVVGFERASGNPLCQAEGCAPKVLAPKTWEHEGAKLKALPVEWGWAMTVHRAQGQTLRRVVLDNVAGAGQFLVGVTRVRRLADLRILFRPDENDTEVDETALEYLKRVGEEEI